MLQNSTVHFETLSLDIKVLFSHACRDFHHESSVQDDNHSSSSVASQPLQSPPSTTGRKTRNSNGSRSGPSSRPGLRSAKTSKSDTEGAYVVALFQVVVVVVVVVNFVYILHLYKIYC